MKIQKIHIVGEDFMHIMNDLLEILKNDEIELWQLLQETFGYVKIQ